MAKMARENKLRERRAEKQARKDARKSAVAGPPLDGEAAEVIPPENPPAQDEPAAGPPEA
jgi:hypothetical protein